MSWISGWSFQSVEGLSLSLVVFAFFEAILVRWRRRRRRRRRRREIRVGGEGRIDLFIVGNVCMYVSIYSIYQSLSGYWLRISQGRRLLVMRYGEWWIWCFAWSDVFVDVRNGEWKGVKLKVSRLLYSMRFTPQCRYSSRERGPCNHYRLLGSLDQGYRVEVWCSSLDRNVQKMRSPSEILNFCSIT
jgi:hypothetical protein